MNLKDRMTQPEIEEMENIAAEVFGNRVKKSYPPTPYDPDEIRFTRMMYIISLVVMMMILLAIAKYYSFILETRGTTLSVLRLCGCTRTKAHIIYMLEIFLTMAVTTCIGYLLYKFVFHAPIAEMYPAFEEFYITPVYLAVMGAYFAAAMVIMAVTVIPSTKTTVGR